jgi:hypothetical protein
MYAYLSGSSSVERRVCVGQPACKSHGGIGRLCKAPPWPRHAEVVQVTTI